MAKGRCESEPMPRETAAGNKPRVATKEVINIGRSRRTAPSIAASSTWNLRRKVERTSDVELVGRSAIVQKHEQLDFRRFQTFHSSLQIGFVNNTL